MWDKLTLIPITVVYGVASLLLFIFGLNLVVFSLRVWRRGRVASRPPCRVADHSLPKVTVQVPIYNELYVSERIIDAVTRFD